MLSVQLKLLEKHHQGWCTMLGTWVDQSTYLSTTPTNTVTLLMQINVLSHLSDHIEDFIWLWRINLLTVIWRWIKRKTFLKATNIHNEWEAEVQNKINILAGLFLLLSCGEQASCFKPDFLLCSPFETAAVAFLLLLRMLSDPTVFREIIFPFSTLRAVGSNNTISTDVRHNVAFWFERGKQQQTIRKKKTHKCHHRNF